MKLKILIVIALILFSTVNVIAIDSVDEDFTETQEEKEEILFSQTTIEPKENYISVNVNEANTFLTAAGKPILPVHTKTFKFPGGTKIKSIDISISDVKSKIIDSKIQPAAKPVKLISVNSETQNEKEEETEIQEEIEIFEDENVYLSSELYPNKWYDYQILRGLDNGVDTVFVKVDSYPVRYSPAENTIHTIDSIQVNIEYEEGEKPITSEEEYDLLIITPQKFKFWLIKLKLHKERMGVSTKMVTVESIYDEYSDSEYDKPEQIKRYIANEKETYDMSYVLLVGGLKSYFNADDRDNKNEGSKDWHVPVRYVNINSMGFISDMYYSDLYKGDGNPEFNDWDPNENGIIGDGSEYEDLDLVPDVYVGRLPCRNIFDVRLMVNKIIKYEKPTILSMIFGKPWMKNMIVVSGRNNAFPMYNGELDGEWLANKTLETMKDVIKDPVKIYSSNLENGGLTPVAPDIIKEFNKGAGFVYFEGHGNAFVWDTHWREPTDPENHNYDNWTGGISKFHFPFLRNGKKQPIVVLGACYNAQINVSLIKTIQDTFIDPGNYSYHTYGLPLRSCFCWDLCNKRNGGAIATIGSTDAGWGGNPPDVYTGQLDYNFFYKIGQDGVKNLGDAHAESIAKYVLDDYGIQGEDELHAYSILVFMLIGDPSLRIGGY